MPGEISVIIADNNHDYVEGLRAEMAKKDIDVLADTDDGTLLLEQISEYRPDCLVMEIILKNLDGIEVLTRMNECGMFAQKDAPLVIINSSLDNQAVVDKVISLGAKYYFRKPTPYGEIAKRIKMLSESGQSYQKEYKPDIEPAKREQAISMQLKRVGVPVHLIGYKYLMSAVVKVCGDLGAIDEVTHTIYPAIAGEYNTTSIRVERSIRYAIESAFEAGNLREIEQVFGYTINSLKGKPTNSEFIAMVADNVMMN